MSILDSTKYPPGQIKKENTNTQMPALLDSVADPGFPWGGARTYDFAKFSQKRACERIWQDTPYDAMITTCAFNCTSMVTSQNQV